MAPSKPTQSKSKIKDPLNSERPSLQETASNQPINLLEWEERARAVLPAMAYDYYAAGATDELTVKRNRDVFSEILLRPKMLCDVSYRDMSVEILGQSLAMPVLIAPTAFHGLAP